ncbi:MAG: hypothetical protein LBK76_10925 [Verrucomicrobiales bacterium]|jgi:hypothetical protein|nr:hypothetical protein [Verrucomicrobiales bacterium]
MQPGLPATGAADRDDDFCLRQLPHGEFSMQSRHERETFHPVIGARREAELLYLEQFSLAERCASTTGDPLVVWDVGLGAAGNAMHLIECWRQHPGRDLQLASFDLRDAALRFALRHHADNAALFPWLRDWDWPRMLREKDYRLTVQGRVLRWTWHLEDFPDLIRRQAGRVTRGEPPLTVPAIVFYDAYSPARCWRMWQLAHWRNLRQVCGDHCELAFHSRATALRVTLLLAGFYVGYGRAIGNKEETTVAATQPELLSRPLNQDWLRQVKRSTSASPFTGTAYAQQPIGETDYQRLLAHPQFL